eukprot:scaffold262039_cov41-Prasinocladus_malaysianus.AAC.2
MRLVGDYEDSFLILAGSRESSSRQASSAAYIHISCTPSELAIYIHVSRIGALYYTSFIGTAIASSGY